jgi:hypothetical protein
MFGYAHPATVTPPRKNAVNPMLQPPDFHYSVCRTRREARAFIPRMCLGSKALYILPIRSLMSVAPRIPLFTNSLRLTALPLLDTLIKLELDMLSGYGMMPRSEQRSLIGREVLGSFSSSVPAQALEGCLTASSPIEPPKNTSGYSLVSGWKTEFPLVNLFDGTLRLNEKTWLPRSVYEWAR